MRLTARAHAIVGARIRPGDWAIDATAGNGYDSVFLARCVGPTGRVFAFDVQASALAATAQALGDLRATVDLIHAGHETMRANVPAEAAGRIKAVLFNLGYLPGSDKQIVTRTATTLAALDAARDLLAPGGILSILAYRGHDEGAGEAEAVEAWLRTAPLDWTRHVFTATAAIPASAPILMTLERPG